MKSDILNLDPEFRPYPEDSLEYKTFTFKGGEEHIEIDKTNDNTSVIITHRINSSSALMRVILANDALRRLGYREVHLYIPYLPYARQDRVMVEGEPLSIRVFADLINACKFDSVTVLDPHSDVGPALIDRIIVDTNHEFVEESFESLVKKQGHRSSEIAVISPDAGAYKKIYKTCEKIQHRFSGTIISANKVRNLKTGVIQSLTFDGDVANKVCVIIDDICDGGRTFIELAKQLKSQGAKRVYLIVTHGIFSYGVEPLKEHLDGVFSTNSFRSFDSEFVEFIEIKKYQKIQISK
jgi:ribose-phosphate pyrophosphokinase